MKKNIIFIVDAQKSSSGGGKKIYEYSNYINSLKEYTSEIIHIKKKKIVKWKESIFKFFKINLSTKYTGWKFNEIKVCKNHFFSWFNLKIKIKNNFIFNKKKDFIILPEIFAHFAEELILKKIDYAIFVQNPYSIFPTDNYIQLKRSYKKAKYVIYISNEIKDGIYKAFPKISLNLIRITPSIDSKKLNFKKKLNLISYMPRKLPTHSHLVLSYLKNHLPRKWKIIPIHNLDEEKTFKILKKSKIFLSFSSFEGLGLPPLEAAIAGNKVIGYTGGAGKEYFKKPIFQEVENGDIFNFCNEILKSLKNKNFIKISKNQRKILIKTYSIFLQNNKIKQFLKKI